MISSEPLNILLPNLVWLCSIISQSVMQKNWFTVFNVKVTARTYMKFGLIVQQYKQECPVQKNGITTLKVKVTAKVQNVNKYLSG